MRVQTVYLILGVVLLAFARIAPPQHRTSVFAAIGIGVAIALSAYGVFAHRCSPPPRRLLVPALGAAFGEEIVWRWGVLAGLAPVVGWPGAFGVSTAGFAYRHTRNDGLFTYLVLGAAFAGAFLATGRIEAAIAAHAAYNAFAILVPR